eukprot:1175715-Amphidinium_carterae.1
MNPIAFAHVDEALNTPNLQPDKHFKMLRSSAEQFTCQHVNSLFCVLSLCFPDVILDSKKLIFILWTRVYLFEVSFWR